MAWADGPPTFDGGRRCPSALRAQVNPTSSPAFPQPGIQMPPKVSQPFQGPPGPGPSRALSGLRVCLSSNLPNSLRPFKGPSDLPERPGRPWYYGDPYREFSFRQTASCCWSCIPPVFRFLSEPDGQVSKAVPVQSGTRFSSG